MSKFSRDFDPQLPPPRSEPINDKDVDAAFVTAVNTFFSWCGPTITFIIKTLPRYPIVLIATAVAKASYARNPDNFRLELNEFNSFANVSDEDIRAHLADLEKSEGLKVFTFEQAIAIRDLLQEVRETVLKNLEE